MQSVTYQYPGQPAQELDYGYFPDGSRHTLVWLSGGAQVAGWTYGYDLAGRLTSVSNSFGETTSWTYDGEGKLTGQTNANGTSLSIGYNQPRGWPTSLTYSRGQTPFAYYALTYDAGANTVGNLTGVSELDGSTVQFGYDALYRLTSEARAGTNPLSNGYSYDLAGNRTSVNGQAYTVDAACQSA